MIAGVKQPTSVSKLYASGAWTFVETDADGKVSRSVSGCLGKDDFAKLKTALDAAPWTITHPQMHCNARTQSYTVFTAGKNTFKEMTCGNDLLDDKTHLALNDADKQIATASAPHDPPCCKK